MARTADSLENKQGPLITIPVMPRYLDKEYRGDSETRIQGLPPLLLCMSEVHGDRAVKDYGVEDCDNHVLHYIFAGDLLSGPLTLLEAARKWIPDLANKESLKDQISGAFEYDLWCPNKWETAGSQAPGHSFVGPHLGLQELLHQASPGNNNRIIRPKQQETCFECEDMGRVVGFYRMNHQQFRELEDFSAPDLVLEQNCGFSEFKTKSAWWWCGWEYGLSSLLHQSGAPVIFTSYTKSEAQRDLRRFQKFCGHQVEVLLQSEENRIRIYRPTRIGGGMEEEIDVCFANNYINIVRVK